MQPSEELNDLVIFFVYFPSRSITCDGSTELSFIPQRTQLSKVFYELHVSSFQSINILPELISSTEQLLCSIPDFFRRLQKIKGLGDIFIHGVVQSRRNIVIAGFAFLKLGFIIGWLWFAADNMAELRLSAQAELYRLRPHEIIEPI